MTPSRRDVLRLLLGAPLAAEACHRTIPTVAGRLLGASVEAGHRWRDGKLAAAGEAPSIERRAVVVVGAGPSGLSAAWRLRQLGVDDFEILDLEPQPGGTSASGRDGRVPHPWGAHYVPVPRRENRQLVRLLDEMGALEQREGPDGHPVAREELLVRAPEERLFHRGRWHRGLFPMHGASPTDRAELTRFTGEMARWARWKDGAGRRAFDLPMRLGSEDAVVTALDRESGAAWLARHGYRSRRLRWYVEYACRDDYGLTLETTSAWAMVFYFASRLGAEGRRSRPFVTWPEGNGRIIDHLVQGAGERLSLSQMVVDVVPGEGNVVLDVVDLRANRRRRLVADTCILALPKFITQRLVRSFRDAPPAHLAAFSYSPWVVANLHVDGPPRSTGFPLAWDNVLYDSPSLGYVVASHQTLRDRGPTILTYYLPLPAGLPADERRQLLEASHGDHAHAILGDLARAHDGAFLPSVSRLDVWRWGHAMVRPTVGFVWGGARQKAAAPLGRLHFAHSDLSGVALFEEAQDRGVVAAEAAARQLGRPVTALTPV